MNWIDVARNPKAFQERFAVKSLIGKDLIETLDRFMSLDDEVSKEMITDPETFIVICGAIKVKERQDNPFLQLQASAAKKVAELNLILYFRSIKDELTEEELEAVIMLALQILYTDDVLSAEVRSLSTN